MVFILTCLPLYCNFLLSQKVIIEEIHKLNNQTTFWEYYLQDSTNQTPKQRVSSVRTIKDDILSPYSKGLSSLNSRIVSSIYQGKLQAYIDENSTDTLDGVLLRRYAGRSFANTKKSQLQYDYGSAATEFAFYKTTQEWYIHQDTIYSTLLKLTPIVIDTFNEILEPYEIRMPELRRESADLTINNPVNTEIKLTVDYIPYSKFDTYPEFKKNIKRIIFDGAIEGEYLVHKSPLDHRSYRDRTVISGSELIKLTDTVTTDTVIVTDPQTYEMTKIIEQRGPYLYENSSGFWVHRLWFWNSKLGILASRIIMIDVELESDDGGIIQYSIDYGY